MEKDIKLLSQEELVAYLVANKFPKFHAKQIFTWLYQRGVDDFSSMSDISQGLRKQLESDFYLSKVVVKNRAVSNDKTRKYLFGLEDANTIESVLIPHKDGRNTICLSSQVGCKFACKFCASGMAGFVRNLTQAEILNQVLFIKKDTKDRISNIVFMGIGEPLDNYEVVLSSIRILNLKEGFGIGQRKITISSAGFIDGISKLAREGMQIELSISLHSAIDEKRSTIMPINIKYPLSKLLPCLKEFARLTKRKITFEYMLLGGFNTDINDMQALVKIAKSLDCKVNLIPFNAVENAGFMPPTKLEALYARDFLLKNDIDTTIRVARGQDIKAACGQLRLSEIDNKNI